MNLNKIILFLLLASQICTAQDSEKVLRFRVVADSIVVPAMNVINLTNEKSTFSDGNGEFSLGVNIGDLLFLQAADFDAKRIFIAATDMNSEVVTIVMNRKITALEEVIVTRNRKQDDLIMRHKDHRDFTPAERKLYTATTGPVDILANLISGRTAQLKKELRVEMNERLLARLEVQFADEYYNETLMIPIDHIRGFQYYLITDSEFVNALKEKNKTLMRFLIGKLALNYNALLIAEIPAK